MSFRQVDDRHEAGAVRGTAEGRLRALASFRLIEADGAH